MKYFSFCPCRRCGVIIIKFPLIKTYSKKINVSSKASKRVDKKAKKSVKCRQNLMSIKFSGTLGGVW